VKRLHTYAATAALAGLLTACGGIEHGEVISKKYVPENDWTYMQPMYTTQCTPSGKTTSCTQVLTGFIPIPMTDPACWRLNLRDGDDTGHVCVSEKAWNEAKVGEQW
jgi:hypothetical protein